MRIFPNPLTKLAHSHGMGRLLLASTPWLALADSPRFRASASQSRPSGLHPSLQSGRGSLAMGAASDMQISLVRHGRPAVDFTQGSADRVDWVESYDLATHERYEDQDWGKRHELDPT